MKKHIVDLTVKEFLVNYKFNEELAKQHQSLSRAYQGILYIYKNDPKQCQLVWELSKNQLPKELLALDFETQIIEDKGGR